MVFLLGGARSGKSALAVDLARRHGGPVTFVATGEPRDDEMRARIARHRAERPADWKTVEAPLRLAAAVGAVAGGEVLVVDCLSLWVANMLEQGAGGELQAAAEHAAAAAAARDGLTLAVSNEVGMGVVPGTRLGRDYRDALGRVNAAWAAAADRALLVVAGQVLALTPGEELLRDAR